MSKFLKGSTSTKSIGHIELSTVLGQGGFGKVYLGYDTIKNIDVAVKFIDKKLMKENNLQEYVEREIEVLRKLNHPHVVHLLSLINSNKGYYLVMELASNGELFDRILESKRFDEDTARQYFQQLISAVRYCHKQGIVHRDLKAENLLVGEKGCLKVCDFGLSRYVSAAQSSPGKEEKTMFTSLAGSVDYQAPEVIKVGGYDGFSCDVWSCGVILYFMVSGYLPFSARTVSETQKRILSLHYETNKYMSDGLADLIKHILVLDPTERYTIDDIISHPWFQIGLNQSLFPDLTSSSMMISNNSLASPNGTFGVSFKEFTTDSPTTPGNSMVTAPGGVVTSAVEMDYRTKLHAAFASINYDHSGFLTRQQVKDMLVKIHEGPVSDEAVNSFIDNFEHDDEGRITEEQFVIGWTRNQKKIDRKIDLIKLINIFHYDLEAELLKLLRIAFDKFDLSKNGVLTEEDTKALASTLGISVAECQELHKMMVSGNGNLTFEVFVKFCTQSDVLTKNPIARRLNRVGEMFDFYDCKVYRNYMNSGFTVAGMRETIVQQVIERGKKIDTVFEKGEENGFFYGKVMKEGKEQCQVGVRLRPAAVGYTKISAYRIFGRTEIFHTWFRNFRGMLREEILACEEDTRPIDDGELL